MRRVVIVAWLAAMPAVGGCGLVVVPTFREFPGPVKSVRVVDAETKAPILGASVQVQIRRLENWFVQPPMLAQDGAETKEEWESLAETDGVFTMKSRCAIGWARIWLPLPPVLGPALLDEPYAHLRVAAPEYAGLVYVYSPQNPPRPGEDVLKIDRDSPADARINEQGALIVYLVRKAANGTTAPCR